MDAQIDMLKSLKEWLCSNHKAKQ